MNTAHLIAQLLEIERAIGTVDPTRVRGMLFEAEESVLQIEQQMIEVLLENENLRTRLENVRASGSGFIDSWTPGKFLVN